MPLSGKEAKRVPHPQWARHVSTSRAGDRRGPDLHPRVEGVNPSGRNPASPARRCPKARSRTKRQARDRRILGNETARKVG